ncbi:hypothetical protein L6164_032672 [Bauhinia variegata]|uniref:Uncharacterized protein n=1 Tax=Bauhinia variegata TaxID=167791 RepID=A0ACB9KPH3_BAUVA|nr:hypothetical protein L6164_032672 [Bauhinia variegata]
MDLIKRAVVVLGMLISELALISHGSIVFPVHHKLKGHPEPFRAMREHDAARHNRRALTALDFGLGGLLDKNWLYYTKLRVGTPPVEYNLQIDSGSSIPWLMCHTNKDSPDKTDDGIEIKLYNPRKSSTSRLQRCQMDKCIDHTPFGDGSEMVGFFVWDILEFGRVNKDFHTEKTSTQIRFGCGTRKSGDKAPPESIGILGLSTDRESLISQLVEQEITKAEFAHCLDRSKGGGIFAIGEVVEPKVKTTTLYVDNVGHYVTSLTGFFVAGEYIDIPLLTELKGLSAIIDSGASMSILPRYLYDPIVKKIFAQQPHLKYENNSQVFKSYCFKGFEGNVDEVFPTIIFRFEEGLTLTVPAHDYIIPDSDGALCVTYSMSEQALGPEHKDLIILGDDAFTNKFVVYDLDRQTIGWVKHDCTTSIKVKDRQSGSVLLPFAQLNLLGIDEFPCIGIGQLDLWCLTRQFELD